MLTGFAVILGLMWLLTFSVNVQSQDQVTFECVRSFEHYAYGLSDYQHRSEDELNIPWQPRYTIPKATINGIEVGYDAEVRIYRMINNQQEIWVKLDLRAFGSNLEYGIYNATTGVFKRILANINDLNLVANQLFTDVNGTVWGIVEQSADMDADYTSETGYYPNVSEFFPLAYFDDSEQRFKLATGEPKVAIRKDELRFGSDIVVVADHRLRVFWLFDDAAIYRYDPQTQSSTLIYTFAEDGFIVSAATDSNGKVYVMRGTPRELSEIIAHDAGSLFVLIVENNSVQQINGPSRSIPNAGNVFVDHEDNLWLGAIAYQNIASSLWDILHPDPDFGLESANFISLFGWGNPKAVLADSAGHIWFAGANESLYGASGLAWYDPATGNGCNNIPSSTNIIEDAEGRLWVFARDSGTLYQSTNSVTSVALQLTSLCSPNPDAVRVWRVRNSNPDPVNFTGNSAGSPQILCLEAGSYTLMAVDHRWSHCRAQHQWGCNTGRFGQWCDHHPRQQRSALFPCTAPGRDPAL